MNGCREEEQKISLENGIESVDGKKEKGNEKEENKEAENNVKNDDNDFGSGNKNSKQESSRKHESNDEEGMDGLIDKLVEGLARLVDELWMSTNGMEADRLVIMFALKFCQGWCLEEKDVMNEWIDDMLKK